MRICKSCGIKKQESEFGQCSVKKGIEYLRWKCKTCKQIEQKKRIKNHKDWLKEKKKQYKCKKCGFDDYRALVFHHKNPDEKEAEISAMVRYASIKAIEKEIEKCIVLCANCHHIEHNND